MSDLALTVRQTAFNIRGGLRNARAVVFTIVMPVVFLVLFNSVFSGTNGTTRFNGATIDFAAYFTPGIIAYSIMLSGFNGLLIAITTNRERGILKRYRGTPMPPWVFLSAQILQTVVTLLVVAATIVVIGWAAYGVHPQRDALGAFVLYVLLGSATMCALGIACTRVTTSADTASAIGPFATVILAFISGVFIPVRACPIGYASRARLPARPSGGRFPARVLPGDVGQRDQRDELRARRWVSPPSGGVAHLQMGAAGAGA